MPSSMRQATPGPSSTSAESGSRHISISNAKKRAGSEDIEDARQNKKIKIDGEPLTNISMNTKDKKKKKRKKKKRTSVVIPVVEPKGRMKSKSRTPSNKSTSVGKNETVRNGSVGDTKHMVQNEEPLPNSSDNGKGRARSNSPASPVLTPAFDSEVTVASGSGFSNVILPDSVDHASEIARLKKRVASQEMLLKRHKAHLTLHHQAVTCQICLDLMYKPFALAPCGHITCYNCLIRWFTAIQHPNVAGVANNNANPLSENVDEVQLIVNSAEARRGTYLRRRKTCPVCRATVFQRPVEMWSIKAMVATLVNSELIDSLAPMASPETTIPRGADNNGEVNNDPWQHIFQRTSDARHRQPMQDQVDPEHMGVYDNEDGGIYRCIDCLHEIWGGMCSGCHRGYPGHGIDDGDGDGDSDLDEVNYLFQQGRRRQARHFIQEVYEDEDGRDQFWDEEDEDHANLDLHHHPVYPMQEYLFLGGDEAMTDSEGEGDDLQDFGIFDPYQPVFLGQPALDGIARIDEGSDEEHGSEYGGSFIDDNEEEGENMDDEPEVFELDDDDDASLDEERPRYLPQNRIQQRRRPLVVSEDEENTVDLDLYETNDVPGRRTMGSRNPARRHAAALLTDDSHSSGDETGGGEYGVLSRSRARARTWVMSDDE